MDIAAILADAKRDRANDLRRANRIITGAPTANCPTCGRLVTARRLPQHVLLAH